MSLLSGAVGIICGLGGIGHHESLNLNGFALGEYMHPMPTAQEAEEEVSVNEAWPQPAEQPGRTCTCR